ncbi:MAG: hypothetical protein ACKVIQ_04505 [Acidimicrobiales bacterium]
MSSEDRATAFVRRTDASLRDLDSAEEIWTASIRSSTEEIRLHGLPLQLDNTIRRVAGPFDMWANLEPSQVEVVRERGPINLLWVISAHPSGRVREAFVHQTKHLANNRILPHLANRSIDFVPQIRELASPLVIARLDAVLAEYSGPDRPAALPTPVHIAVNKLLAPRTGMVSPPLLQICIDLAKTAGMPQPRSFRGGGMAKMLHRCNQTLDATSEPEIRAAVEALIAYFNQAPPA